MEDRPWYTSYEPGVPRELAYPSHALPEVLADTARRFPRKTAIHFFGRDISYRELDRLVNRFANLLRSQGVKPGDRVALYLPNVAPVVIGYYGILRAGAVVTLVNPLQTPRDTIHQLKDSGTRFVVALDAFVPVLRDLAKEVPLSRVWITRIADYLPPLKGLLYNLKNSRDKRNWIPWPGEKWFGSFRKELAASSDRDPGLRSSLDDLALLQYTGGTTGLPKGVMLTHRAVLANAWQAKSWVVGMTEGEESVLTAIPIFHCYGMTVGMNLAVAHGATMVLVPKFMVRQIMKLIHDTKPSIFPGVQTMYVAINNHPDVAKYDLRSIKACISGAGALHVEVQRKFEQLTGGYLVEGYGLTEASPVTHCNPLKGVRKVGCIGVPLPGTDSKIVDLETGEKDLPPGEIGEIVLKGPQVMQGYWNRPEETAKVLRDGWLYTGDIGEMDADGFFKIVDRKSDMIKVAGENVYPREVEEVLFQHDAVLDCVAAGVPNETLGDIVKAYVILKGGASVTPHELLVFCKKRLAKFKWPKEIELRAELPKNMVGKALRRFLKAEELERIQVRRSTGHHHVTGKAGVR